MCLAEQGGQQTQFAQKVKPVRPINGIQVHCDIFIEIFRFPLKLKNEFALLKVTYLEQVCAMMTKKGFCGVYFKT